MRFPILLPQHHHPPPHRHHHQDFSVLRPLHAPRRPCPCSAPRGSSPDCSLISSSPPHKKGGPKPNDCRRRGGFPSLAALGPNSHLVESISKGNARREANFPPVLSPSLARDDDGGKRERWKQAGQTEHVPAWARSWPRIKSQRGPC